MKFQRIEVGFKKGVKDVLGEKIKKKIVEDLGFSVLEVKTIDVYNIEADLSEKELKFLGENLFIDPVVQQFTVDKALAKDEWLIELGFKPGVTDNVGRTAKEAIEEILNPVRKDFSNGVKRKIGQVYTSKKYLIKGNPRRRASTLRGRLERQDLERISREVLANELIQRWLILRKGEREKFLPIPRVEIPHRSTLTEINLNVSDEELLKISEKRKLALNLKELKAIREYFLRPEIIKERREMGLSQNPTDAELEAIAQSWSEHCKHKIFNAKIIYQEGKKKIEINSLFKTFIKGSTEKLKRKLRWLVSVFWDNSGVMEFNKDWLFCFKCETHNSPSNEEPYGGALTGIVGVYRDPMGTGKGARLIYGTYGFCTGNPFYPVRNFTSLDKTCNTLESKISNGVYKGQLLPKFHPKRLLEGVRKGVEDGGNKSGVPTVYGITFFDDGYIGKPAIFVSAGGLIPKKVKGKIGFKKEVEPGDLIVMAGGRVGLDGIHGATESSLEAGERISASHVQIGDPFTQKKLHDFLIEARDLDLFNAITDNGAGGLSCSVGEMAKFSGGFELWLDKVPLKYLGLDPWQILVSESQERMTLAVSPQKINKFLDLAKKHNVEATVLGKFTDSKKFYSTYKPAGNAVGLADAGREKTVTYLNMDFVHEGVPQMKLEAEWQSPENRRLSEPTPHQYIGGGLKEMLSRTNICSKEYIVRQFDHEVQGTSVIKHLIGKNSDAFSDGVVIKPLYESNEGLAISVGINPKYGLIDTYWMTALAIDEAIRRIIAVGGSLKQIAFNDNFCWPNPLPSPENPDAKYKLAQLVRANQALYDFTLAFGTPCISGKDSMFMDGWVKDVSGKEKRISALPTLQILAVGKIKDVRKCITMDVKKPGDLIYILGLTKNELGGSEYYEMRGEIGKNVPKINSKTAKGLYNSLSKAIEKKLINSCHGIYRGGLAVHLAQISFAGSLGIVVDLDRVPREKNLNLDKILYSESAARFLATVSPENKKAFEEIIKGNVFAKIGKVRNDETFKILFKGKPIIEENLLELKKAWQKTFKNF